MDKATLNNVIDWLKYRRDGLRKDTMEWYLVDSLLDEARTVFHTGDHLPTSLVDDM